MPKLFYKLFFNLFFNLNCTQLKVYMISIGNTQTIYYAVCRSEMNQCSSTLHNI